MKTSLDRVLITGGSGFIGTNLIDACAASGSQIVNLDVRAPRKSSHSAYWRKGDVMDWTAIASQIADFRPTAIVHLAARTDLAEKSRLGGYAVNYDGTDNLIRAARAHDGIERVVFVSTMLVTRPGHVPRTDDEYSARTLYGESKVLMEKRIRAAGDLPFVWTILRPPLVWGPWVGTHYQNFFRLVARGRYFHVAGGRVVRTLGFVGNVVRHIIAAASAPPAKVREKVFYVGDDQPTMLRDWAEEIRRQLGAPPIRSIPYPVAKVAATGGDLLQKLGISSPIYSFRLINLVTDWALPVQPMIELSSPSPITLSDGVASTIAWMRAEKILA